MKIHLSVYSPVYCEIEHALIQWEKEKIIPSEQRACDGLMMLIKNRAYLTTNHDLVTCKHCLREIAKK